MASVSNPVLAYVATLMTASRAGPGQSVTATVFITAGWEMQLPVWVRFSRTSGDPVVFVYPSSDGGANYDSTPMVSFSIARIATGTAQASVRLPTGIYAIQIQASGGETASFQILTAMVLTAIGNV
jgi:hypothetical protein